MKKGGIVAVAICSLLCLSLAVFTGLLLATLGVEYGIFDIDAIVFDGLAALSNGGTAYENTMNLLRSAGFVFLLVVGGSMLAVLLMGNKRNPITNLGGLLGGNCLLWTALLLCFQLLLLFDFSGFARTAFLILLFLLLVLAVVFTVAVAKRTQGRAVCILMLSLAVGFFVSAILAGLIGSLLTVFGDAALLLALMLSVAGTGGSSRVIYVIVIA